MLIMIWCRALSIPRQKLPRLGKSEETLIEAGIDYAKGVFPFSANSRARAQGHSDGFVKILACAKTDKDSWCAYHWP